MIPEERIRKVTVAFIQITAGAVGLYGLTDGGGVWRYYPTVKEGGKIKKYSGWYRLTQRGFDATGPGDPEDDERKISEDERDWRLKQ